VDGKAIYLSQLHYTRSECLSSTSGAHPCETCRRREICEAKISHAIESLKVLLAEHTELKIRTNRTHSQIVNVLPIEIMSIIFVHCLPDYAQPQREDDLPHKGLGITPIKLGSVCKAWRDIAWSTPELWTHISIPLTKLDSASVRFVNEWETRSGSLPLVVEMHEDTVRNSRGYATIGEDIAKFDEHSLQNFLVNFVTHSSHRWRDAYLRLSFYNTNFVCSNISNTTSLRTLHLRLTANAAEDIDHPWGMEWDNNQYPPMECKGYPGLKTFSVFRYRLKFLNSNWKEITGVTIGRLPLLDCLDLLRFAPLLETCHFLEMDDGFYDPSQYADDRITHTNLQTLVVSTVDCMAEDLFDHVVLPNLVRLSYSVPPSHIVRLPLISFMEQSACPLEKLEIEAYTVGYEDLEPMLRHIPSLKHLRITPVYGEHDWCPVHHIKSFLRGLTSKQTVGRGTGELVQSILPRLETLQFSNAPDFPWELVPDIFGPPQSLCDSSRRPLKTFELLYDPFDNEIELIISSDIKLCLKALRDAGAQIIWTSGGHDILPL